MTVIVDRRDRHHEEFWTEILADLNERNIVRTTLTLYPLADKIAERLTNKPVLLELIERGTDVLIVNWDAINGDPDFGGDAALRWFEHRQFGLRAWIRDGGMLIIEGQANQGVPDDRYYSAVLGDGEVRLSGREDPLNPDAERRRMTGDARMTRIARQAVQFEALDLIEPRKGLEFEVLFPRAHAGRLVPSYLHAINTDELLYRGWFRRTVRRGTLSWVPYVRRAERWPKDFPVMLTAKWNDGVVFVTTLLLSATKQTQLIQAMLLTHGKVSSLPEPGALRRVAYRYAVKAAAGVLSGLLVLLLAPSDTNVVIPVAVATAVTALLDAMPSISRGAARLVRSFTGA
ncbi:MAG: hypothetical protein M3320_00315 [Actinomycetota bacterium]|nr:hypothetical protein [Actinomycetota bacterium]MDQ5807100.1 hypothetical protein [Actinomycetota bacterium]